MASTTGIEVSSDSCVLVSVGTGSAGGADVRALHTIGAAEWRAHQDSRADLLRSIRKAHRLPRRTVVVAWDLRDEVDDEPARLALRFLEDAGFRIQSILTPPQALARVAEMRRRPGSVEAIAWTALTTHGAAIAIVGGRELLFSRTFSWTYRPALADTKSQLLQRYSLVAHLAPEVRRGMELVRASHGLRVEGVVTCGDLPELRSLTMPLIEELDLEVETLDSTEGLRAAGNVTADRLRELAPAIRAACAAVLTSGLVHEAAPSVAPIVKDEPSAAMRAAAAVALIGALAWGAFLFRSIVAPVPVKPMPVPQRSAAVRPGQPAVSIGSRPVSTSSNETERARPAGSKRSGVESQAIDIGSDSTPVSTVLSVRAEKNSASGAPPGRALPASGPRSSTRQPDPRGPGEEGKAPVRAARQQPLLEDPLPGVESILIDQDRRFALVDGAVVGVGDPVGPRTVIRIEPDALLLQEPSGRVVRASVRRKQGS
jgi:hypothetical protein